MIANVEIRCPVWAFSTTVSPFSLRAFTKRHQKCSSEWQGWWPETANDEERSQSPKRTTWAHGSWVSGGPGRPFATVITLGNRSERLSWVFRQIRKDLISWDMSSLFLVNTKKTHFCVKSPKEIQVLKNVLFLYTLHGK